MNRYEFQQYALGELNAKRKELCKKCPHKNDNHGMNCIECCPLNRIIEHMAGLDGAVVHKDGMSISYSDHILDKPDQSQIPPGEVSEEPKPDDMVKKSICGECGSNEVEHTGEKVNDVFTEIKCRDCGATTPKPPA